MLARVCNSCPNCRQKNEEDCVIPLRCIRSDGQWNRADYPNPTLVFARNEANFCIRGNGITKATLRNMLARVCNSCPNCRQRDAEDCRIPLRCIRSDGQRDSDEHPTQRLSLRGTTQTFAFAVKVRKRQSHSATLHYYS